MAEWVSCPEVAAGSKRNARDAKMTNMLRKTSRCNTTLRYAKNPSKCSSSIRFHQPITQALPPK